MKWKHWNFHCKANEHSCENPNLNILGNASAVFYEIRNTEAFGTCLEEQSQECDEHQSRTKHCVKEEFDRCVLTLLSTPNADQEKHRQQYELKEHEEQNQVLSNKCSGHAGLQN